MPYRERLTTWQRALEDGAKLAAEPARSYAGRVPTVRRICDRLASALAEASTARPWTPELDELVVAMRGALAMLDEKLAVAIASPDIVITAQPHPQPQPVVIPVVIPANGVTDEDPPPYVGRTLREKYVRKAGAAHEAALARALGTPRGLHLHIVRMGLHHVSVQSQVNRIRSADRRVMQREPRRGPPIPDDWLIEAVTIIEEAVRRARKLLEEAPPRRPADPELDAALEDEQNTLLEEIAELEDVAASAALLQSMLRI